ncbi:MAG: carbohydrate-binding protein [Planctomycetota bacterium]
MLHSRRTDCRLAAATRSTLEALEGRRLLSQTPFLGQPHDAGAVIEAEHYDLGDAYFETDSRDHGGMNTRGDGVDIGRSGGRTRVGWAVHGEWLEYTVRVDSAGSYEILSTAASGYGGGSVAFDVDGVRVGSADINRNGWGQFSETSAGEVQLSAGEHIVRATFLRTPGGDVGDFDSFRLNRVGGTVNPDPDPTPDPDPQPTGQQPYSASPATPGQIEAEWFDEGGEGVAYHEMSPENYGGDTTRPGGVDVRSRDGRTNVGWIRSGEWLEYTVDVAMSGNFGFTAEVATAVSGARVTVTVDGLEIASGAIDQRGWNDYNTLDFGSIGLSAGRHVFRFTFEQPNAGDVGNFDYFTLTHEGDHNHGGGGMPMPSDQTPFHMSPASQGTIEAEHFDNGGEGVAFHEMTAENFGGNTFRDNGVDIRTSGGRTFVGWAQTGEWLEYTVNNLHHADFDLSAVAATGFDGAMLHATVNGQMVGMAQVQRNGWGNFSEVAIGRFHMHPGTYVIRIQFHRAGGGDVADLDSITITPAATGPDNGSGPTVGGDISATNWHHHGTYPRAVMEGMTVDAGHETYIWGGYFDHSWGISRTGYAFNHMTGQWRRVADLPIEITHAGGVEHDGKIYLFGGFNGAVGNHSTDISDKSWVYDIATNTFSSFVNLPYKVSGHGVVKVGNRVHILSGMERENYGPIIRNLNNHVSLDLDNPSAGWRTEADTPIARDHVSAVVVDDNIYLLGGQINDNEWTGAMADMWVYHSQMGHWMELTAMPEGRGHIDQSVVVWQNHLIVVAGNGNGTTWDTSPTDTVFAYSIEDNTWSSLPDLPGRRFGTSAFLVGDTLHAIGGGYGVAKDNHWTTTLSLS